MSLYFSKFSQYIPLYEIWLFRKRIVSIYALTTINILSWLAIRKIIPYVFAARVRSRVSLLNSARHKYLRSRKSVQPVFLGVFSRTLRRPRAELFHDRYLESFRATERLIRVLSENSREASRIPAVETIETQTTTYDYITPATAATLELVERVLPSVLHARVWPTCDDEKRLRTVGHASLKRQQSRSVDARGGRNYSRTNKEHRHFDPPFDHRFWSCV